MKRINYKLFLLSVCMIAGLSFKSVNQQTLSNWDQLILSHTIDPHKQSLQMRWKDSNGDAIRSFKNLSTVCRKEGKQLVFAMNGGMYQKDRSPLGLYIENGKVLRKVNRTKEAYGNFYMQPNGVFYTTFDGAAHVIRTTDFVLNDRIKYATQSGPMLLINGKYHPKLNKESKSTNIRNGVGILPNGKILFAMSKKKVNFYTFATYFKEMGCKNALYLDGFVSRTYLPSQNWKQEGGNFGVIISEVE